MRGEELVLAHLEALQQELPPHARRRAPAPTAPAAPPGITSACAEKSKSLLLTIESTRNYLRMRGEEHSPYLSSIEK